MKYKSLIILAVAILFSLTGCSEEKIQEAARNIAAEISSPGAAADDAEESTSALSLGDSAAEGYEYENDAAKVTEDTTYYNEYLGISYTLPAGWWLYSVREDNFTTTQGVTGDYTALDISRGDGYSYIDLISCANLQYSTRDNHVGVDLYAESVYGITTLEEYVSDSLDYLLEPYEDETYTLISEDAFSYSGKDFVVCYIEVGRESEPYEMLYAFCELNEDYFLTVNLNYWPENTDIDTIFKDRVLANLEIR